MLLGYELDPLEGLLLAPSPPLLRNEGTGEEAKTREIVVIGGDKTLKYPLSRSCA